MSGGPVFAVRVTDSVGSIGINARLCGLVSSYKKKQRDQSGTEFIVSVVPIEFVIAIMNGLIDRLYDEYEP